MPSCEYQSLSSLPLSLFYSSLPLVKESQSLVPTLCVQGPHRVEWAAPSRSQCYAPSGSGTFMPVLTKLIASGTLLLPPAQVICCKLDFIFLDMDHRYIGPRVLYFCAKLLIGLSSQTANYSCESTGFGVRWDCIKSCWSTYSLLYAHFIIWFSLVGLHGCVLKATSTLRACTEP